MGRYIGNMDILTETFFMTEIIQNSWKCLEKIGKNKKEYTYIKVIFVSIIHVIMIKNNVYHLFVGKIILNSFDIFLFIYF